MKKGFFTLFAAFFLFSFLFCSCAKLPPATTLGFSVLEPEGDVSSTENEQTFETDPITETVPAPAPSPTPEETQTLETPAVTQGHKHSWELVSQRGSTCTVTGEKGYRCICGNTKKETLPLLNHTYSASTCTSASVCYVCGHCGSAPLGHSLENKVCTRCSAVITTSFFALGRELEMDEASSSVVSKLGTPTETITEGKFISLIYAADLPRLTVIQTDEFGLCGIFTMDPLAWADLDGIPVDIASLTGVADLNSDAFYRDISSYRIFGFRDKIGTEKNYAMWILSQEYAEFYGDEMYSYVQNSELYGSFYGQNRISYYYVNALRAKHSVPPLTWSELALQVANEYSAYMIENNIFKHDGSYLKRLQDKGVKVSLAGENISRGYANAYFVCDAYYNSISHRENILDSRFTHVGMGYQRKSLPLAVYGAQIFYS